MKTIKIENIIQTKEVARILGCTPRNISLMVRKGKLKPIKILENKEFLFDFNDIKNMKKCRLYENN
jgi:DNA-binding transcriptional MerR regulator